MAAFQHSHHPQKPSLSRPLNTPQPRGRTWSLGHRHVDRDYQRPCIRGSPDSLGRPSPANQQDWEHIPKRPRSWLMAMPRVRPRAHHNRAAVVLPGFGPCRTDYRADRLLTELSVTVEGVRIRRETSQDAVSVLALSDPAAAFSAASLDRQRAVANALVTVTI